MSESNLPPRPNLAWLKKTAKQKLRELRKDDARAALSAAQLAVARQYGFRSWRALHAAVETTNVVAADGKALAEAIARGDEPAVRAMVAAKPALLSSLLADGFSPLHTAAEHDEVAIVRLLLARGADPHAVAGQSAHTPLSWALTTGSFEAARALVASGVKPDLFCAAGLGLVDAVRSFFDERGVVSPGASRTGSSRYAPDGTRLPRPPETPGGLISDALYIACRNGQADTSLASYSAAGRTFRSARILARRPCTGRTTTARPR